MDKQVNLSHAETEGIVSEPASDTWITQLTQDRRIDQQAVGILRASGTTQSNAEVEVISIESEPAGPDSRGTPPRPGDFPLFL